METRRVNEGKPARMPGHWTEMVCHASPTTRYPLRCVHTTRARVSPSMWTVSRAHGQAARSTGAVCLRGSLSVGTAVCTHWAQPPRVTAAREVWKHLHFGAPEPVWMRWRTQKSCYCRQRNRQLTMQQVATLHCELSQLMEHTDMLFFMSLV
jgi:hypothetical protein